MGRLVLFGSCGAIDEIKCGDVDIEKKDDEDGVEYRVSADEVIDYVVGGAVAAHEEHIVVVERVICAVCGYAKRGENGEAEGNIALFHACHARDDYVEGGEACDRVGDSRDYVIKAEDWVAGVVLSCTVGACKRAEYSEDEHEVEGDLLEPSFREGGEGNCDKLDTAKEEGKVVQPTHRVFSSYAKQNYFEKLKRVYKQRGDYKSTVFVLQIAFFVAQTDNYRECYHYYYE